MSNAAMDTNILTLFRYLLIEAGFSRIVHNVM